MPALEYLAHCNAGGELPAAAHVVVIGGGNAAVDAARCALRRRARATIAYRRAREQMPAFAEEIEAAEREGVIVRCNLQPLSLTAGGILVCRTRAGAPDASGRPRPVPIEGSEEMLQAELVLSATGQVKAADGLGLPAQLKLDGAGLVLVEPESGKTSLEGVYAAGDLVPGKRTVTWAIASGKRAAASLDAACGGQSGVRKPPPPIAAPSERKPFAPEISSCGRERPPELEASGRVRNFDEVVGSFSEEQALREAARCLMCGSCAACRSCVELFGCPAFYVGPAGIRIDAELCMGCGVCAALCPNGAIAKVEQAGGGN